MKPKNLIVFDMDGVIVDVSNSYRDVVRQTTRQFLGPAAAAVTVAGASLRAVRSCGCQAERRVEQRLGSHQCCH